eukprot:18259-Heterococcus_DN1.PRE.4
MFTQVHLNVPLSPWLQSVSLLALWAVELALLKRLDLQCSSKKRAGSKRLRMQQDAWFIFLQAGMLVCGSIDIFSPTFAGRQISSSIALYNLVWRDCLRAARQRQQSISKSIALLA